MFGFCWAGKKIEEEDGKSEISIHLQVIFSCSDAISQFRVRKSVSVKPLCAKWILAVNLNDFAEKK